MKKVMTTYSLKEALESVFGVTFQKAYYESLSTKLKTYLEAEESDGLSSVYIKFADFADDHYTYKDYVEECLDEFYNRYYNHCALIVGEYDDYDEEKDKFFARFLSVLNATYPKYAILIKNFEDNKAKLMDLLSRNYQDLGGTSGSSSSRFNDTPQDGGAFGDDNHTTNITEVSSSTSSNLRHQETYSNEDLILRLKKVQDNLSNLYIQWENEIARILWVC